MIQFAIPLGAGIGRFAASTAASRWQLFRTLYSKSQQHPFGFGVLYAGGTTVGYHSMPLNWKTGGKYVGRPQRLMRL